MFRQARAKQLVEAAERLVKQREVLGASELIASAAKFFRKLLASSSLSTSDSSPW